MFQDLGTVITQLNHGIVEYMPGQADAPASGDASLIYLVTPTAGQTGVASEAFTYSLDGAPPTGTVTCTQFVKSGGAGAFLPGPTSSLSGSSPTASFTFTPAAAGTYVIGITNDGGLINPPDVTYVATDVAPPVVDLPNWLTKWDPAKAFRVAPDTIPAGTAGKGGLEMKVRASLETCDLHQVINCDTYKTTGSGVLAANATEVQYGDPNHLTFKTIERQFDPAWLPGQWVFEHKLGKVESGWDLKGAPGDVFRCELTPSNVDPTPAWTDEVWLAFGIKVASYWDQVASLSNWLDAMQWKGGGNGSPVNNPCLAVGIKGGDGGHAQLVAELRRYDNPNWFIGNRTTKLNSTYLYPFKSLPAYSDLSVVQWCVVRFRSGCGDVTTGLPYTHPTEGGIYGRPAGLVLPTGPTPGAPGHAYVDGDPFVEWYVAQGNGSLAKLFRWDGYWGGPAMDADAKRLSCGYPKDGAYAWQQNWNAGPGNYRGAHTTKFMVWRASDNPGINAQSALRAVRGS
jgi:hypothetical protein